MLLVLVVWQASCGLLVPHATRGWCCLLGACASSTALPGLNQSACVVQLPPFTSICTALPCHAPTHPPCFPNPASTGEATLGKGDLEAKGESLYVANYAY